MLCSTHAVQRKCVCCGLKLFGINSLNLRKRVSVASVIRLGFLLGFEGFCISFPEGAILMITVSMKCLAHCVDPQGHVLVTLRTNASFSFPLQGRRRGVESKQVTGGLNPPLGTCFSPSGYRQAILLNEEPQLST